MYANQIEICVKGTRRLKAEKKNKIKKLNA